MDKDPIKSADKIKCRILSDDWCRMDDFSDNFDVRLTVSFALQQTECFNALIALGAGTGLAVYTSANHSVTAAHTLFLFGRASV